MNLKFAFGIRMKEFEHRKKTFEYICVKLDIKPITEK